MLGTKIQLNAERETKGQNAGRAEDNTDEKQVITKERQKQSWKETV